MKIGITLLIVLFSVSKCLCQKNETNTQNKFEFLYLISIKNKAPIATKNAFISPSDIDSTFALPASKYNELCKLLNVSRIWFKKVKPSAKVLTLNKVFNLYNIPLRHRILPVKINDDFIENPETLLISPKEIESVSVIKKSNHNYIRIIETGYFEDKKILERAIKNGEEFIK